MGGREDLGEKALQGLLLWVRSAVRLIPSWGGAGKLKGPECLGPLS